MTTVELTADFLSALAHPNRLRILEFLRRGEKCSCEIQPALGIEQSNLSRHIKLLLQVGILTSRRDGPRLLLAITNPAILEVLDSVSHITQQRIRSNARALKSGMKLTNDNIIMETQV